MNARNQRYNKSPPGDQLTHHGILGQKWGVRRYQNKDGSLTPAGRKRYADNTDDPRGNQNGEKKSRNGKKIAIGISVGAAVVAGTVLTAYLVKKYGGKNIAEFSAQAQAGKDTFENVVKNLPIAQVPVSAIPAHTAPIRTTPTKAPSGPTASLGRPKTGHDIPNNYSFESLMQLNSDLLQRMYSGLS